MLVLYEKFPQNIKTQLINEWKLAWYTLINVSVKMQDLIVLIAKHVLPNLTGLGGYSEITYFL
jgi:hypothetical protein